MNLNSPIGIFDSGVGGLTVLKELTKTLPGESYIYYADSGNCPYGNMDIDTITANSINITRFLVEKGCKLIVVACNTITTNIINTLRETFNVPFVGMEPATKPASIHSKTKSIGILATQGTLNGNLFLKTMSQYADDVKVCKQVGKNLVTLIENDKIESEEMKNHLISLLKPMYNENIDSLVLGCTHYNYLTKVLHEILPPHISIIDNLNAISRQTNRILTSKQIKSNHSKSSMEIYTSGTTEHIQKFISFLEFSNGNTLDSIKIKELKLY